MTILEKYKDRLKKKTKWSWASDIVFFLLLIALIIPTTRTPLIVFVKRMTLFGPSVSANDNYGQLSKADMQWSVIDDKGNTVRLEELSDKPVFINFWATWCAPCIAEMPSIEELYTDYHDKVHFVIVTYEGQNLVTPFMQKHGFKFPTYHYQTKEPELLQSKTIPATFIITKKGEIVANEKGTSNWNSQSVRSLLDKLIQEP